MKNTALVLLSGGQDSTTCLFWAKSRYEKVIALGFDYGQKHKKELEQAKQICDMAGVEYIIKDVKGVLQGSSLTDHTKDINAPHDKNESLPSSFTAGRNALFLTIAGALAYSMDDVPEIVTGVCQTDYSGYPDCRETFVRSQESTLSLALDYPIVIRTPLMRLTKAETWKLAAQLSDEKCADDGKHYNVVSIIKNMTLTDYNGDTTMNDWGMGKEDNPASKLRAKGYREAVKKGWV